MSKNRLKKMLPVLLDPIEIKKLLGQLNEECYTGRRNKAIISLILSTGLRRSEITNLKINEINFEAQTLRVTQGKGNKDRDIFIPDDIIPLLKKWAKIMGGDDFFFSTIDGQKLKDVYLNQVLKRLGKKAGIKKIIYPHLLRHIFATEFYRQTKDLGTLRMILGHSNINTTMIYVTLSGKDIQEKMKDFKIL